MDFSKLSQNERMAAIASAVVVVSALISITQGWGPLMWIALLAGIAALVVIFAPQIMPGTRMPGSNGSLLTVLGGIGTLVWIVVLIDNLGWVGDHIIHWDTWQYIIGLVAVAGVTWYGWMMLQSEGGQMRFGSSSPATGPAAGTPPPATTAAPAPPAEPASEPEPSDEEKPPHQDQA